MKNHLFYFLLLSFCLLACNSDSSTSEKTETLVANYYIRYLEPERQIKVEASFAKFDTSGRRVPIPMESGVQFQNETMGHRELPGGTVRHNFENFLDYPGQFKFQFQNLEGKPQQQELSLAPLTQFSINGEVSQSSGGILSLEGNDFQEEESLVMLLSDLRTSTISIEFDLKPGMTAIQIPSEKLLGLQQGAIKMYLVKKQIKSIEEDGYAYTSTIEYYSKDSGFLLGE